MITLKEVSLQRGVKPLLQQADLTLYAGQKIGITGRNGCGKSSLFQLLLGELTPDSGELSLPAKLQIAHMAQEVAATDRAAADYVLDGHHRLRELEAAVAKAEATGDNDALAHLYADLEAIDGFAARYRAEQLLQGLGFSPDQLNRPVRSFSGGWRIRLNLAQALMSDADLLLLDEPTNHLDLDATIWLEQWLKKFPGTLLLISHDRDFLDRVVDHIVHFENHKTVMYRGNYSAYERQKAERLAQQQQAFEKQQQRVQEIQQFVSRFRAKATKAKQAQSRLKELERMELIAPAHIDSPFSFHFLPPAKMSSPLLSLKQATLGYREKPILHKANLRLLPGSRIGLLGANGAGKSTLIKSLVGDLPILDGERVCGENLSIGYFAQHQLEALDDSASALLHLQRLSPQASEQSILNFLGGFDFRGERATESIGFFSGGEKARLALAIIAWQKPNLLLMDEPTNHLDLDMRHALTVALQDFEGALVVVSHDRHLLRNTVDEFWLVADHQVREFPGDLDEYQAWLQQHNTNRQDKTGATDKTASIEHADKNDRKQQRQAAAAQRQQLSPLKKQVQQLEKAMETLQGQLASIEGQLADTGLYDQSRKDELQDLLKTQGALRQQLEETEEAWLGAQESLETLEQQLNQS